MPFRVQLEVTNFGGKGKILSKLIQPKKSQINNHQGTKALTQKSKVTHLFWILLTL